MSRLKSTGFVAVCVTGAEAVVMEVKNQTKEAEMTKARNTRVFKLHSPCPDNDERPVTYEI
jgi:hypothetical protein